MSYYYSRVGGHGSGSSSSSSRGFKLNQRRFSVQGLRSKFVYMFRRVLSRWRFSCLQALRSVKRSTSDSSRRRRTRSLVMVENSSSSSSSSSSKNNCRLRYFAHSNSFYSEAIADCLEFIKRSSSISVDDHQKPVMSSSHRIDYDSSSIHGGGGGGGGGGGVGRG